MKSATLMPERTSASSVVPVFRPTANADDGDCPVLEPEYLVICGGVVSPIRDSQALLQKAELFQNPDSCSERYMSELPTLPWPAPPAALPPAD